MADLLPPDCTALLRRIAEGGRLVVVTGAGVSAESGIPTFRGPEGYWRVGAREYQPMELATAAAFRRMPWDVWSWYLYRRGVCRRAQPNAAHRALVALDQRLQDRFLLVTQNVDGLHMRAGSPERRVHHIHGSLERMRCSDGCGAVPQPLPDSIPTAWDRGRRITQDEQASLTCPACGALLRPHVLWFDECYDEDNFRWDSSLRAAADADLLAFVGTSGATNLPLHMAAVAAGAGTPLLVLDPEANPFSRQVAASGRGWHLRGTATVLVPALAEAIVGFGCG